MDQDEITQQVIEIIVPSHECRAKMLQDAGGLAVRVISVKYGRKFSTADYESAEFEVMVCADRDGTNSLEEDLETVWTIAKESVKAQALPVLKARDAKRIPVAPSPPKPTTPASTPPTGGWTPPTKLANAPDSPPATGSAPPVPAAQGEAVKSGTAELTKIMVQADGKVEFYCKGFRYPFKDSRGAEVVITLFDEALGWKAEHLVPGKLYELAGQGYKVDWHKSAKGYYDVLRVYK